MELASLLRAESSRGLMDIRRSPAYTTTDIHPIRQNEGFCPIRAPGAGYKQGVQRERVAGGAGP